MWEKSIQTEGTARAVAQRQEHKGKKNKGQLTQLMAQIGLELGLNFSSAQLLFTNCPPCVRNYSLPVSPELFRLGRVE